MRPADAIMSVILWTIEQESERFDSTDAARSRIEHDEAVVNALTGEFVFLDPTSMTKTPSASPSWTSRRSGETTSMASIAPASTTRSRGMPSPSA